jgi:DNA-directed RNA polymerase subunit RPC12/RpoP
METPTTVSCPNCGAQVDIVPGRTLLKCPYCETEIDLVKPKAPEALAVEWMLPTDADRQRLRSQVHQMLAEAPDAPDDVLANGRMEEEAFLFKPMWRGEGNFVCH